jgi:hypothetical protein
MGHPNVYRLLSGLFDVRTVGVAAIAELIANVAENSPRNGKSYSSISLVI